MKGIRYYFIRAQRDDIGVLSWHVLAFTENSVKDGHQVQYYMQLGYFEGIAKAQCNLVIQLVSNSTNKVLHDKNWQLVAKSPLTNYHLLLPPHMHTQKSSTDAQDLSPNVLQPLLCYKGTVFGITSSSRWFTRRDWMLAYTCWYTELPEGPLFRWSLHK